MQFLDEVCRNSKKLPKQNYSRKKLYDEINMIICISQEVL